MPGVGVADLSLLCKNCHRRRPWLKLRMRYARGQRTRHLYRVWSCDMCGGDLRRDDLTARMDQES